MKPPKIMDKNKLQELEDKIMKDVRRSASIINKKFN